MATTTTIMIIKTIIIVIIKTMIIIMIKITTILIMTIKVNSQIIRTRRIIVEINVLQ